MANFELVLSQKVIRGLRAFLRQPPGLSNPTHKETRILIRMNPRTRCAIYLQSSCWPTWLRSRRIGEVVGTGTVPSSIRPPVRFARNSSSTLCCSLLYLAVMHVQLAPTARPSTKASERLQTLASLTKAGIASAVKMIACAMWILNHLSAPPSQTSCRVAS